MPGDTTDGERTASTGATTDAPNASADNDAKYEVVVRHDENGTLGRLNKTFDSKRTAAHAAFDTEVPDVNITTDVVQASNTAVDDMVTKMWTDGASRGNPGPSAGGVVIEYPDGSTVKECVRFERELTNNQAEYRALLFGIRLVRQGITNLSIRMDSELVVKQITGEYSVTDDMLRVLHTRVNNHIDNSWDITHVPREDNRRADRLANEALDS